MKVIYYRSQTGNFGDDLNAVLWRKILPPECFDADDAVLLGIGSILRDDFLTPEATRNRRVFILGSGAGTGPLPSHWPNGSWSILAVRGPLTARLIGRPEAAITDGAALIAATPSLLPKERDDNDIVFIPHYNSVAYSRWQHACAAAGLRFVDPHWPVETVIGKIGRARLVISEAMHGAIVADTLRIPWVPVVCSPDVAPFKWADWTGSLRLGYSPLRLPPSSAWEALRNVKKSVKGARQACNGKAEERHEDLLDEFHRRFARVKESDLAPKPMFNGKVTHELQKVAALFDRLFVEKATEALMAASKETGCLSDDSVFGARVERLQDAVERLKRALTA